MNRSIVHTSILYQNRFSEKNSGVRYLRFRRCILIRLYVRNFIPSESRNYNRDEGTNHDLFHILYFDLGKVGIARKERRIK